MVVENTQGCVLFHHPKWLTPGVLYRGEGQVASVELLHQTTSDNPSFPFFGGMKRGQEESCEEGSCCRQEGSCQEGCR